MNVYVATARLSLNSGPTHGQPIADYGFRGMGRL
jgi:hypothetical protein